MGYWDRKSQKRAAKATKKFAKCKNCKPPYVFCKAHTAQAKAEVDNWVSAEDNPAVHVRWDGERT